MTVKGRILIVEDDPDGLRSVADAITDAEYEAVVAAEGRAGLGWLRQQGFDAVLTDLVLPDMDGLSVMAEARRIQPDIPVLIMTAYGSVETAVRALKEGAYDYLVKPLDLDELLQKVRRAVETGRLRAEVRRLRREIQGRYTSEAMVAVSAPMREVLRRIAAVADTNANVLVLGESGTGKELVARALHYESRRAEGPFVAVNCGAFPETLLESALFGHEKGAFTGAVARHEGAFERAHGGTLFLDEIGTAPHAVQTRLLRAIEEREVLRVGGREPIRTDARIVAASNRPLGELAEEGAFRHDLLYRLQVVTIHVPPLRERRDDIRPLAERFITAACAEHGRHIEEVRPGFFEKLEGYHWPGNVRELRNAVEAAVILASKTVLDAGDVRLGAEGGAPGMGGAAPLPPLTLEELERKAILQALQQNRGNRQLTAEQLGVSARTIQRKIQEYRLPF